MSDRFPHSTSSVAPAFLFDLDGTLYTSDGPVIGAADAVCDLRRRGIPVRFITNTTRMSRRDIVGRMESLGFVVHGHELFTPAVAALDLVRERSIETVAPFVAPSVLEDLTGVSLCGGVAPDPCSGRPGAIVVGDMGNEWTPGMLNEAFRYVLDGALLVALQMGRYWMGPSGLEVDAGAYVAALEFATGKESVLCGKPRAPFFDAVVRSLGLEVQFGEAGRPVMVGDDVWNDVAGAQQAGLAGWLVRTGKFREEALAESGISPDRVIDSVADVM